MGTTQTYNIGTQLGNDLYESVKKTGVGANTTDGARLSLGADGNVYAFKNGVKMKVANNWQQNSGGGAAPPTSGGGSGSRAGAPTAAGGAGAQSTPYSAAMQTYGIGTKLGNDLYDYVKKTGIGVKTTDGAYLSLGADGNVYAFKNGVKMAVANNWPQTTQDAAVSGNAQAIAQALAALWSKPNGDYLTAQRQATDAAVSKAVSDLNAQKEATKQSYADIFRRLYINKMMTQKNMDQQLAAQGITGGMAETTRLGYDNQYADALRAGEIEKLNTLAGLDQAITDTRYNGDISYAQLAAQEAQNRQNNYSQVLAQLLSRQDDLDAAAISQGNWEKTFAAQQQQAALAQQNTERGYAYETVMQALKEGQMVDDAALAAAGISKATAQAIVNAAVQARQDGLDAAATEKAYQLVSSALGYGVLPSDADLAAAGISKETAQAIAQRVLEEAAEKRRSGITQAAAQTAVAAALAGQRTDNVRQIIEGYYGMQMETVLAAYV